MPLTVCTLFVTQLIINFKTSDDELNFILLAVVLNLKIKIIYKMIHTKLYLSLFDRDTLFCYLDSTLNATRDLRGRVAPKILGDPIG